MTGYQCVEDGFKEITSFETKECHKSDIFKIKLFSRECKKVADEISVKNKIDLGEGLSKEEYASPSKKKPTLFKNKVL